MLFLLFSAKHCVSLYTMFSAKHSGNKSGKGFHGENMACRFLENRGFRIIQRNYNKPYGEIDIIAKKSSGILSFIEVKTMTQKPFSDPYEKLAPEDHLTIGKLRKLKRICSMFGAKHPEFIDEEKGWQIDLVSVLCPLDKLLTENEKYCIIKHYENIA